MSILKLNTISDSTNVTNFTFNSDGVITAPSGLEPNVIDRGNTPIPLILSSFNDIHYYNNVGSSTPEIIDLGTQMISDSVYELTFTGSGGANINVVLRPNFLTYENVFDFYYSHTDGSTGVFVRSLGTFSFIYFDHQGGTGGSNPMGRMVILNGSLGKEKGCTYFGCDRPTPTGTYPAISNVVFGFNRWNNLSFSWNVVGRLEFSGNNKRVWIRRIA